MCTAVNWVTPEDIFFLASFKWMQVNAPKGLFWRECDVYAPSVKAISLKQRISAKGLRALWINTLVCLQFTLGFMLYDMQLVSLCGIGQLLRNLNIQRCSISNGSSRTTGITVLVATGELVLNGLLMPLFYIISPLTIWCHVWAFYVQSEPHAYHEKL